MASLTTMGRFRYGPTNNGSNRRRDGGTTDWWLIVDIDPELGRYLREVYSQMHYRTVQPKAPLWGTHVSVIRGEVPANAAAWKQYESELVEVHYKQNIEVTGEYLWLPVSVPRGEEVRVELGLQPTPTPSFHLTFGNTKSE